MTKRTTLIAAAVLAISPSLALADEPTFGGKTPDRLGGPDTVEVVHHHFDGMTIIYQYQTGWAIHMELYDGLLKYEWIAGAPKGVSNKDLPYRTRKIGNDLYILNWYEADKPDFVTLVFNFEEGVMYSSGLLHLGTDNQFSVWDGGIISDVKGEPK